MPPNQNSPDIGAGFGIVLIILGAIDFISGNFIGGVWLALIGFFLRGISQSSYQQVLVRNALQGEPVRRFMRENPVTLKPSTTVRDLVEDYVYKYHHKFYPVKDESPELSCITLDKVKAIPKENWDRQTVGDLAESCSDQNMVAADTDAIDALKTMRKTGKSRLMVVDNGNLVGVIALKDMLEYLSLKTELEEESS
ncbi:MAG: CBS domain-containing protein [candidate division Zixibacteria bacterium]|nr:CBS domain-containing protein [candidate division Zixibacteria bacterium]